MVNTPHSASASTVLPSRCSSQDRDDVSLTRSQDPRSTPPSPHPRLSREGRVRTTDVQSRGHVETPVTAPTVVGVRTPHGTLPLGQVVSPACVLRDHWNGLTVCLVGDEGLWRGVPGRTVVVLFPQVSEVKDTPPTPTPPLCYQVGTRPREALLHRGRKKVPDRPGGRFRSSDPTTKWERPGRPGSQEETGFSWTLYRVEVVRGTLGTWVLPRLNSRL